MAKRSVKNVEPAGEAIDAETSSDVKQENAAVSVTADVSKADYSDLVKQVQSEYLIAYNYMKPKIDEWSVRLKLYNNQKRDKEAIGDPLLFTSMQTVLASLYSDRLGVDFLGRESGDEETAENLGSLAEYDYDQMSKDIIDYDWDFDTCFFGRGLLLNMGFDRDLMCPMPEVIDPLTWLRDPHAKSVNGDMKGRGAMKYGGREIRMSKNEMRDAGIYFGFDKLKPDTSDQRSLVDAASQSRDGAQGRADANRFSNANTENADIRLLEWFTNYKGKKVLVTLGDGQKTVVRYTEIKTDYWPIVDRVLYPLAHDWDAVSIPDLIEDKQRARAVVQNLGLASIKIALHPTYLYDSNKIKNREGLAVDFNKHIPIEGNPSGAIQPVERQGIKSEVDWILGVLNSAAQQATATPSIQQGIAPAGSPTAAEVQIINSKIDNRFSLSAKIFGWSEKEFWQQWYQLYKQFFAKQIDTKVIRLNGAMGSKWRKLTRENIISKNDPDVRIESRVLSEAKKTNDLQKYRLFLKDVMATDPQSANIRLALRKIGRLSGFSKDEIEQILPPVVDELNAEAENEKLDAGTKVDVQVYDDDFMHMVIHNKAADTPEKLAHINAHRIAMMLKKAKPEMNISNTRPTAPIDAANAPVSFMKAGATPGAMPGSPAA